MLRVFPFQLNIRQKVVVGFTISMLVMGSIGAVSFHYLHQIERKQYLVQIADDLSNIILEIRRYEKNYLLYGLPEDLEENRKYVKEGMEVLAQISPEIKGLRAMPKFDQLEQGFLAYGKLMEQMAAGRGSEKGHPLDTAVEDHLRERGKNLVDISRQLVTFERERIVTIVGTLKTQLLSSLTVFLILGAFLIPFVGRKIIRPLRVIERTTLRIAHGDFTPLPVLDTRDETQRVVEAFNRMIGELEKRQDQLVQAKKLSSLGILTSGIAHQLNNPLNNISTSCQILLEEIEQAERDFVLRMLTNIEQEVRRARDIVRGLLEFSRVKEFALVPTSISEVVNRSLSLISSQVPPGIELVKEVPEDLILNIDAQRMQQVFLNLIMNAIQAIDSPPGQIRIVARRDPSSREAVILVEDTGMGISQGDLARVFDPFFTTKEVSIGTGLGLSIVYGIVQKHQGSISVESKEGEGTRFRIQLPMQPAV